jgi:acetyltransferase-like isoleucine patch superfamily enzyme
LGNNNSVKIADGCRLTNLEIAVLGSNNELNIGNNCTYSKGLIWLGRNSGSIILGNDVIIDEAKLTLAENNTSINIGANCLLAWDIDIRCGDGHPIFERETGTRINKANSIEIQNHVWVSSNVQILKNVLIGHDCVIGTKSLVTKNAPPNSLIGGIPAKVLRENVDWTIDNPY